MSFQICKEKTVSSQIENFQKLVSDLVKEGDNLPKRFVTHGLVDKLLDSWKEYKHRYNHHRTYLNLQQTIIDIQIKETNRMSKISFKAKEFTSKANIVEGEPFKPPQNSKKYDPRGKGKFYNKNNPNPQIQKKKGNCFNCGKTGHYAAICRVKGNFKNNNNNKGSTLNKANVVETKKVITAMVFEAHLVSSVKGWVVDSTCTRHIGVGKTWFVLHTKHTQWKINGSTSFAIDNIYYLNLRI